MSKRRRDTAKDAKAKRSIALARVELGHPTEPRDSADSPVSAAVKRRDPGVNAMVQDFLQKKGAAPGGNGP